MLKGEVFGRQLFENQIFALFINTFLNGNNGVCGDYLNGMEVTYSGSNVTVDTGAVCIQGRFLEEDSGTTISAGTNSLFCKLVIEIDLDKVNTDDTFNQGYYKVITDSTNYPTLTQTDIVGTNSGVYQYELARFKTSANGISDFVDTRTYLDIPTIYDNVRQMVQDAIDSIEDGSAFALKTELNGTTLYENETGSTGNIPLSEDITNIKRLRISGRSVDGNNIVYFSQDIDVILNQNIGILFKGYRGGSYDYIAKELIQLSPTSIIRGIQQRIGFPNTIGEGQTINIDNTLIYIDKVIGFNY